MAKLKIEDVYKDFEEAAKAQSKLIKEMEKDFNFALGKQWEDEDLRKLESRGVKGLTINKIKPMIKIITGIERQSRSDFVAFPEGAEDSLVAEVTTRLLKNVVKRSDADKKLSDQFKEGMTGGLSFLEPYIDYTYDLLNGELKLHKVNASRLYMDPNGEEYDLADRRYIIKFSPNLSKEQVLEIFPDDEKKLEDVSFSKVDIKNMDQFVKHLQETDYRMDKGERDELEDDGFDLIEYYYKCPTKRYYVASRVDGTIAEFETKDEAEAFVATGQVQGAVLIEKKVPEIRLKQVIGDVEFSDEVAWSYPRWKGFPFIPFVAERMSVDLVDSELQVQGVARGLRDLQLEYNKRRTQELHHLNSSVNSGNYIPKDALDRNEKKKLKDFGSSPGVTIFFDPNKTGGSSPQSWRVSPTPLSQGHAQLAVENAQDIKEASGINPDLLANDTKSQSGRAILLKQRQGLVMVQEALDNYSMTKKLLGRFLLAQLGEIFTVETAVKVLGEKFLEDNKEFHSPVLSEEGAPQMDEMGQIQTQVDPNIVGVTLNKILNDASLGKYDVSIGEGAYNETIKFTNFTTLMEMAQQGIPIPPDIIIQESLLSESQKERILSAIEAQRQQLEQQAVQAPGQGE